MMDRHELIWWSVWFATMVWCWAVGAEIAETWIKKWIREWRTRKGNKKRGEK